MCPLWFTGVSYSCVVHTQPVPPAQGKACRRWRAAKGCNECGAERHLWSRGPDTNPRMTIVILHSPAVSLWNDKIRRKICKKSCILNCTLLSLHWGKCSNNSLHVKELNPSLTRDKRGHSPLYWGGTTTAQTQFFLLKRNCKTANLKSLSVLTWKTLRTDRIR